MGPALANFLFEAVNFLLLAVALGWILFRPVRRALDAERDRHEKEEQETRRLREEAEAQSREAQAARQGMTEEAEARRRGALAAARQEAARIVEDARSAQHAERQQLERELATRRGLEAVSLADEVGRIAAASVRSLLGSLDGPSLDEALARAARAELEAIPTDARRAARVESARPLAPDARTLLQEALGKPFEEQIREELGAGVRILTPAGQVDASAASLARQAARAVSAAETGTAAVEEASHGRGT